jgi:hypothetical protein
MRSSVRWKLQLDYTFRSEYAILCDAATLEISYIKVGRAGTKQLLNVGPFLPLYVGLPAPGMNRRDNAHRFECAPRSGPV